MARMREGAEGEREVMGMEGEAYSLGRDFCAAGVRVNRKSQKEKGKEIYLSLYPELRTPASS